MLVQGGVDTGTLTQDTCEIRAKLPEDPSPVDHASAADHRTANRQPQRSSSCSGRTPIPTIDLQVSGTLQSLPGPEIAANFTATSAIIAPSLGRPLCRRRRANVSVNLVEPGTMYGERLNQLDLRVGKILRFGGSCRATLNFDLYNALNVDTVLALNNAYATLAAAAVDHAGALREARVAARFLMMRRVRWRGTHYS